VVNDPRNPLAKYQKAVVLAAEERYEEALAELEELKAFAPKEATVFFLMGAPRGSLGLERRHLESRAKAAAILLVLEVPAGWASPSSRGLWGVATLCLL
jgi:predicted Zn-dependent protease